MYPLLFNICHEVLKTGKLGRPVKVLPKGMVVRLKNKSSKRRDSEGKLKKVETPKTEHPETTKKQKKRMLMPTTLRHLIVLSDAI